ncbi:MAG: isopentenyl-diphosphate Delta-isomerase [Brooklawnia sp.]
MTRVKPLPDTADLVVLVDEAGQPIGTADRLAIHTNATPLHLAFSSYLFDPEGRLLITRRALGKLTWAGVWTNSCCGHLRPGEDALQAAARRIPEELGVQPSDLRLVLPDFRYRAMDASGVVENEICPVMVGRIPAEINPDPAEISEYAFVAWEDFQAAVTATPAAFSPWSVSQMAQLAGRQLL